MNKIQFNELINYLQCRPSEAERLRAVLGKSESKQTTTDEWLTAKEVGNRVGRSSRWIRSIQQTLPQDCIQRRGKKQTLYFNYPCVEQQLKSMRQ